MSTISITTYDRRTLRRPAVAAPVRLTRRGRLVLVLAIIAALAVGAVVLGSSTVATDEAGAVPATRVVTVQEGQTLWQIAAEANPEGDVRDTVDDIMRMNSLPSAGDLQLGSDLAVPVYQ
ncbi:LysM domain-containing protein [Aeromicrobium sp. CnD17-E]|uniref:LysM peptidoglycan-binding domain-containing protein n=1 Tax=Aeromicrobium sp. CnD17-E TaxID=2954487 RepID=UPI002096EFE9|nr:LysM domain-containing protein [Aeromicrobium sp. CnD17-E]MCO7237932.1 LysM peptidoglycan-binding domain-containing protein [Aeromicrobium sp. CnD17-E]